MTRLLRIAASLLGITLTLSACGGQGAPLPSLPGGTNSDASVRNAALGAPLISVPRFSGDLRYSDEGRRAPNAMVRVGLTLRFNHQAELDKLVADLSDPHSRGHRHFLTPRAFDDRFAPTRAQEGRVVRELRRAGFTITERFPNRVIVDAIARASVVEKFFSTEIHTVHQGKYGERYTNVAAATAPAAIAPIVRDVSLNNLIVVRTVAGQGAVQTPTPRPFVTPKARPTPTASPTPSGNCNSAAGDSGPLTNSYGTLATGVAKPFDFPVQHGCNGAGETAAVAIDDPVNKSYLSTYLSAAKVTQSGTVTNEAIDGGGSGDDPETDLDVQTISGLAPGANIIVYDMGSLSDQHIEDTYNKVLTDGTATAVNSSFGGCESDDESFDDSTNSIAEEGASEGVEFSASSGDYGSQECYPYVGVSAPAGDPYFTSIGGIDFTDTSAGVLESVVMGSVDGYAGGGGVSSVWSLPSYQKGITGMITTGRNQPDISLPFFPVAVYTGGSWGEYLGTSWSSPASVAMIVEANELLETKLGWIDPTIYSLFSSTGYSDYYTPCTSGNNGDYKCKSTEYNQAAGIGAPKAWALANAL